MWTPCMYHLHSISHALQWSNVYLSTSLSLPSAAIVPLSLSRLQMQAVLTLQLPNAAATLPCPLSPQRILLGTPACLSAPAGRLHIIMRFGGLVVEWMHVVVCLVFRPRQTCGPDSQRLASGNGQRSVFAVLGLIHGLNTIGYWII